MPARSATAPKSAPALGAISIDRIYPLPVFQQLSGLNRWALRECEKQGLKISKAGRRKYVSGRAWFDFLAAQN